VPCHATEVVVLNLCFACTGIKPASEKEAKKVMAVSWTVVSPARGSCLEFFFRGLWRNPSPMILSGEVDTTSLLTSTSGNVRYHDQLTVGHDQLTGFVQ
jgi:hypothetical protein